MKTVILFITLLITTSLSFASENAATKLNRVHLELVKLAKPAPPLMAWHSAFLNQAATNALFAEKNKTQKEAAYYSAGVAALKIFYPNFVEQLKNILKKEGVPPYQTNMKADALTAEFWESAKKEYEYGSALYVGKWPYTGEYEWRSTPPAYATPLLFQWGEGSLWSHQKVTRMTYNIAPPLLDSDEYKQDLDQVSRLGSKTSKERSEIQTQIAKFWAGGPGSVTPPGFWVRAGVELLESGSETLAASAIKLTILAQALSDAGRTAWSVKYKFIAWRPITALREAGQTEWESLLDTPPFPGFVSGHSTFSSAGALIIDSIFHFKAVQFQSEDTPGVIKTFTNGKEAADEAGISRIYGGIHVEADNREGKRLGRRVACAVLKSRSIKTTECN